MKSERVVSNPENHGWEEVNGKWIWASGRNTGHITDGDTEGQIATWHDPANAWTPQSAVIVDSGTGDATFSGDVHIPEQITFQKSAGNAHSIKADTNDLVFTSITAGKESMRLTYAGNATFSGNVYFNPAGQGAFAAIDTPQNPLAPCLALRRNGAGTLTNKAIDVSATDGDKFVVDYGGNATFSGNVNLQNGTIDARIGTKLFNSGDNLAIGTVTNHSINFYTNNVNSAPRLTIDATGDATFSGTVSAAVRLEANTITSVAKSGRAGFLFANNARILPCDDNGTLSNGVSDLGRPDGRYQYLYLSESVISTRHGVSLGTRDLIETLATLRASTLDETVDVRQALASACDKLIEKFESMHEVATQEIDVDG